jgi:hypothetical protein
MNNNHHPELQVCDFGLAIGDESPLKLLFIGGTDAFMAPEVRPQSRLALLFVVTHSKFNSDIPADSPSALAAAAADAAAAHAHFWLTTTILD